MRSKSTSLCCCFLVLVVSAGRYCKALSPLLVRTARNWLSIFQHLQTPDLYDATWANACQWNNNNGELITTRAVQKAEILSLFPVHALCVDSELLSPVDHREDDESSCRSYRHHVLTALEASIYRDSGLAETTNNVSVQALLDSRTPGWLGHLASSFKGSDEPNCMVVSLLGAAPFCALVSLGELEKGIPLLSKELSTKEENGSMEIAVLKRYSAEIAELRSYTTMAHPSPPSEQPPSGPRTYHPINCKYPGLIALHQHPRILEIKEFLTATECQRLITKARPHLQPCLIKNADTGAVEADPTRTSTNANIPRTEIPSIVTKVCSLLNCNASHLEMFQVLHYTDSQQFSPHTDGFDGPTTACGFEHSGRLATLFCYLNSLPANAGGETHFSSLGLKITPVQGTAVVHFPNTVDLQEDVQTEHESIPVVGRDNEKWLLVTWLWKHARSDPRYHEALLPSLGDGDVI